MLPHQAAECGDIERLAHECVCVGEVSLGCFFSDVMSCNDDDRNVRCGGFITETPKHLPAVHAREFDVENDQIREVSAGGDEPGFRARHYLRVPVLRGQCGGEQQLRGFSILDDEDAGMSAGRSVFHPNSSAAEADFLNGSALAPKKSFGQ